MMPRRIEFWFYGIAILAALAYGWGQRDDVPPERRMPRPPLETGPVPSLPPAARDHMTVRPLAAMPRGGTPGSFSSGTAFAINGEGDWLSARHVTRGCSALMLFSEDNRTRIPVSQVIEHQGTDLALLRTEASPPQVTFTHRQPRPDEDGFHIGFPQGTPASVRSGYLGAGDITLGSANDTPAMRIRTVAHVWAERQREPSLTGTLGGMSGGPTFDGSGRVIGVTVAEQPRRGRVVTVPPEIIEDMLRRVDVPGWRDVSDTNSPVPSVTESNFDRFGEDMRRNRSVARVYCFRPTGNTRRGF